jgi:hypothetical protein
LIDATKTATTVLGRKGMPPRQARKGRPAGRVRLDARGEWLRLTLTRPGTIDLDALTSMLRTHLGRRRLAISVRDRSGYRRVFNVHDLSEHHTAQQVAEMLGLDDAESRGQERVAELKKTWTRLVRQLALPPLT